MKTAGLNFADKNQIRRLMAQGTFSQAQIASIVKVSQDLVKRYLTGLEQPKAQAAAPVEAPAVESASDDFGPLKGTEGWDLLAPGAKMAITKKRNAAAAAAAAAAAPEETIEDIFNGNPDNDPVQPGAG